MILNNLNFFYDALCNISSLRKEKIFLKYCEQYSLQVRSYSFNIPRNKNIIYSMP